MPPKIPPPREKNRKKFRYGAVPGLFSMRASFGNLDVKLPVTLELEMYLILGPVFGSLLGGSP